MFGRFANRCLILAATLSFAALPLCAGPARAFKPRYNPETAVRPGMSAGAAIDSLRAHGWRADPHGGAGPTDLARDSSSPQDWFERRGVPNLGCVKDGDGTFCALVFIHGGDQFAFRAQVQAPSGEPLVASVEPVEKRGASAGLQDKLPPGMSLPRAIRVLNAAGYRHQPVELLKGREAFTPDAGEAPLYAWYHAQGLRGVRCDASSRRPYCRLELSPKPSAEAAGDTFVLDAEPGSARDPRPKLIRAWANRWYE